MKLSNEDCAAIRQACCNLAMCWDALREVEKRHPLLELEVHPDLDELASALEHPPRGYLLTDAMIRQRIKEKTASPGTSRRGLKRHDHNQN